MAAATTTSRASTIAVTLRPGEWSGVDVAAGLRDWRTRWWRLLWHLVLPVENQRTLPTRAGAVLIAVALGIGMAAYNNANNVLFMALSLLLSSLVLSGVLSWLNFRGVRWRMSLPLHWRAGEPAPVRLEIHNSKKLVPTYSLLFRARARRLGQAEPMHLPDKLDPGQTTALDWIFQPRERGLETVEISAVESLFPFGFLRKTSGGSIRQEIWVWPARLAYEFQPQSSRQSRQPGEVQRRVGAGADLLGLRPYRIGDAPRMVHWKASARLREIVVRQTVEEQRTGYFLLVDATRARWSDTAQFERLCSLVASLAEDLFMSGRLRAVSLQGNKAQAVRRLSDLHGVLNDLARLEPIEHAATQIPLGNDIITFQPGARLQIHVYLGGQLAGSA